MRYPAELQDLLIPDPEDAPDLAGRLRGWRARADHVAAALAPFSAQLRAATWDDMAARFVAIVEQSAQRATGDTP